MGSDTYCFGDCASLIRDNVHPKDAIGMSYIGLEHIEEGSLCLIDYGKSEDVISTKLRFCKGDLLFGKLRPYFRKVIRAPFDGVCSTEIWVVRAKPGVDQGYLYYWMASQSFVDFSMQGSEGTRMPRAKWEHVIRHEQPKLKFHEQQTIAYILETLDDKIELNRKMNETLEAMARAIFKSWFVDFDIVQAKSEGYQPKGLNIETTALFPDSFEDSELGKVPKGWMIERIENIAERVAMGPFGSSIKVATFVPVGIPVISGQHLNHTLLQDSQYNFITEEHADQLKNSIVFRGDIVFTHAGNIGQVAYIPETAQYSRYIISQRQFYMRCDITKISPLYIVYFFKTQEGQHRLLANTSSTGVPSISRPVSYLKTIQLLLPPKELSDAFDIVIKPLHSQISKNITQLKILAMIRDTLLPKLLSGEIRIKDAESVVEDLE